MKAPFPYFGGKSSIASVVWERFGGVRQYVEPFFGSGAVLLGRPGWREGCDWVETVNDKDGFVANAWRAIARAPEAVARHADWPVNEIDLHARHAWLTEQRATLTDALLADPEFYDAKIAGWWIWGMSCWIGSGFCSGSAHGKIPHLSTPGQGVHRKRPHLSFKGVHRVAVHAAPGDDAGNGEQGLYEWMNTLGTRLRRVRVCCGDWQRVVTDGAMMGLDMPTAVFLDPPYGDAAKRDMGLYALDDGGIAGEVRAWCMENGNRPQLRIALCGYRGEGHEALEGAGWSRYDWKTVGGYAVQNKAGREGTGNYARESIWFSPQCLPPLQGRLW